MRSRDESTVEQRLRLALSGELVVPSDPVDMSADAVTRRLLDALEMSTLCLELVAAGAARR